ncbi:MAG TPA: carboxypeptidase-like regulatory domain-containing protein [Pyrinomonadaceae bacterium]|jgi:hypothetical protein
MRRAPVFVVLIALVLLCANSLSAQGGDGALRIEVTDVAGHALSRACVTVVPREGEIVFRQCNRKGKVNFKGLAPGSYRVVVKVDGYEAQKREVTVGASTETVAFSLQPRKL